jgi:hypothetical protein
MHNSITATLLTMGFMGGVFGQSSGKTGPEPKCSDLPREDSARLDQPREISTEKSFASAAKRRYSIAHLTRTKSDLPILQDRIDERVFKKSQTDELPSLDVAFGDVLASKLPLR